MSQYLPLEYDRSHLLQTRKPPQSAMTIDYYDVALIVANALALLAILVYYLTAPRRSKEEITVSTAQKGSSDIPYFIFNRPGKKSKGKEAKDAKDIKELNPHTQITGYNLVELKCLKCTAYSTDIYEPKTIPDAQ